MVSTPPSSLASSRPSGLALGLGLVLVDDEARRAIREDLDATLIVEAAAGTGKTTELVRRIVAVLREGKATLDRIVAVTFTEKAAGEMKLRLRGGLERARTDPSTTAAQCRLLDGALAQLEVARIGTIHSLCADLLRERPVEARVDPLFEVAAEDEAERLFEQSFDLWFQSTLKAPPEGVRRILRRRGGGRTPVGPRERLREAAWKLAGQRDFAAPWRREPFDRDAEVDRLVARLASVAPLARQADRPRDYLAQSLHKLDRFLAELGRRELIRDRDHDGLEAELVEIARWKEWGWKGGGASYGHDLSRAEVLAARDAVRRELDLFVERSGADLAACLHEELKPLVSSYDDLKARAGKLDFLDLLLRARDLVRDSRPVREEHQRKLRYLFVDEFQDTDPLQAEILLLLAADDPDETRWTRVRPVPGKLFIVGDPKQSIYRFRRADVALYEATKERLRESGARVLYLATSFRSVPSIQAAVNAAFAPVMRGGDGLPAGAVASQAQYVALESFRPEEAGQPTVIALPVPRPYSEWGKVTDYAVNASLPDAVGAFVDWLITSGWTVTERDQGGRRVPLEARHVCLLFKRFQSNGTDLTRGYVRALEARRIPHVLVGGRSFHDREEVQAVRNALVAIEWPDDELSVYATLRGPFFALADDALLGFRHDVGQEGPLGSMHPLRHRDASLLTSDATRDVAEALAILRELHLGRNVRPIADTVGRLLEATRAHAGIAIWPTGEQALANVLRVMDLARRFEASGATSFRAFVERLDADASTGQAGEAPVVEEGTEGVRIMTVHRAKGLEFPVVILADPTAPATFAAPTRHVDQERGLWAEALAGCIPVELAEQRDDVRRRDAEESVRLAYVAATRARDLLVVPTVGDEALDGWLSVLNPVLYPDTRGRRLPDAAPGCPAFGNDSVLARPLRAERTESASVAPGRHAPSAGTHAVVWWDPRALDLDRQPEGGLRQQRILTADDQGEVSRDGVKAHAAWAARRAEMLKRGSEPSVRVRTVTDVAEEASGFSAGVLSAFVATVPWPAIALEATAMPRTGRPKGNRFGILVHAVLAAVDLDAQERGVGAVAAAEGRLIGASAEEIAASATAVIAALSHPLLRRAAVCDTIGECRRESPVLLPMGDGTVIEGVVDLAFREYGPGGAEWTVVDFKTDTELEGGRAKYETQVRLYVMAIGAATGEPARGVLFSV